MVLSYSTFSFNKWMRRYRYWLEYNNLSS